MREGEREGGEGGRVGMTVIHILMAPQYLNNNQTDRTDRQETLLRSFSQ